MTHGETLDDSVVPPRIRVVVAVALAVPQLVIGIWGIARPMHWFTNFPGIGPRLIAAEPPFNAHLATDTGAGFLATGVALTFAVALGRRVPMIGALLTYLAFAIPHTLFHLFHRSPGLTDTESVANISALTFAVVLALMVMVAIWRKPGGRTETAPEVSPVGARGSSV